MKSRLGRGPWSRIPVLMCSMLAVASAMHERESRGYVCDNCCRVLMELGEAQADLAEIEQRIADNADEIASLEAWRSDLQGRIVALLAEPDHESDSWQIRYLLIEWEWSLWAEAWAEAIDLRDYLLGEKSSIEQRITDLQIELIDDCELIGTA